MSFSTLATTTTKAKTEQTMEEARDKIAVMLRQEATVYRRRLPTFGADKPWRQNIVEWMFNVMDSCKMSRDMVAVAAYYLDATPISTREDYQLCAMTALQLAMKLYDSSSLQWSSLVKLGRNAFDEHDMALMETRILNALQWRMHPPTGLCFLRQYMLLLQVDTNTYYRIEQVSRFVFEFAVCFPSLSQYPPSQLAYAGMCMAMQRMDAGVVADIQDTIEAYAGVSFEDIEDVYNQICQCLQHNVALQELLVNIDARCAPYENPDSPLAIKQIIQLGSSPRQISG